MSGRLKNCLYMNFRVWRGEEGARCMYINLSVCSEGKRERGRALSKYLRGED